MPKVWYLIFGCTHKFCNHNIYISSIHILLTSDYFYSHCEAVFLNVVFNNFIQYRYQCSVFSLLVSIIEFNYTTATNLGLYINGRIGFSSYCHNKNKNHRDQISWIDINNFYNIISFRLFLHYNQIWISVYSIPANSTNFYKASVYHTDWLIVNKQ